MAAAPNIHPICPGVLRNQTAQVTTANTARDGTGSITALFTASTTNGSIVSRVGAVHTGAISVASTAMVARLWKSNGGTPRLIDEVQIPSVTPSASVVGTKVVFGRTNIQLAPGDSLGVSISVSEVIHFDAEGGDY